MSWLKNPAQSACSDASLGDFGILLWVVNAAQCAGGGQALSLARGSGRTQVVHLNTASACRPQSAYHTMLPCAGLPLLLVLPWCLGWARAETHAAPCREGPQRGH